MLREDFYYIVSTTGDLEFKDFENLKMGIHSLKGVGITEDPLNKNKYSLFYDTNEFKPEFDFGEFEVDTQKKFKLSKNKIKVTFDVTDEVTPGLLKAALLRIPLRTYSKKLDTLLPIAENLFDATFFTFKSGFSEIYKKMGMSVIFNVYRTTIYYTTKDNDPSVYLVNSDLIDYFEATKQFEETPELYYKVADSIEDFVAKYDVVLIPMSFYEFYGKSFKIINRSNFNIENPGRKVFVKPLIFELNNKDSMFHTISGESGSRIYMTKILQGETLDMTLKRFLSEDLKVTGDYIGAYVDRFIDFDRDRENRLTPRLIVRVYVGDGILPNKVREEATRGWNSINN